MIDYIIKKAFLLGKRLVMCQTMAFLPVFFCGSNIAKVGNLMKQFPC